MAKGLQEELSNRGNFELVMDEVGYFRDKF